ncbi:MAG: SUMF1/EgtB/PvdO family nonheme iron enzyme [Anaerolineae bacterium]|nr:SUMF1/EgtB/PvdO family nonheme iron enzyme [Anaerolineae bacterium]
MRQGEIAGSLIEMLASKEVAFMYVVMFDSFVLLFWLLRVAQDIGIARRPAGAFEWQAPELQRVIGHVILFVGAGLFALPLTGLIRQFIAPTLYIASPIWILIPVFLALWLPLALSGFILWDNRGAASGLMAVLSNGRSALYMLTAGLILGAVVALLIVCIIDVIRPVGLDTGVSDHVWPQETIRSQQDHEFGTNNTKEYAVRTEYDAGVFVRLLTWIGLPVLVLAFILIFSAVLRFPGDVPLPWREILLVVVLAVMVASVFVMFERRSFVEKESTQPFAADPTVTHREDGEDYNNLPIYVVWFFGTLVTGAIVASRLMTNLWDFLNRQPTFDVGIVIFTLVLPWAAAFPVYWAGYNLEEYNTLFPEGKDTVRAALITVIPFFMVSVSLGLAWNWKRWLPGAAIFMGLFAFFFTTLFSNPDGAVTGMIGSLGYWLEQQGVRRGDQPQYYYMLTQLPVYEFLPMLGAMGAGLLGLTKLWDWRRDRIEAEWRGEIRVDSACAGAGDVAPEFDPHATRVSASRRTAAMQLDSEDLLAQEYPAAPQPLSWWDRLTQPFSVREEAARRHADPEWIGGFPFLLLTGWWAITIVLGLTIAGEKMPWLTTHLVVPLALLAGWWLGRVVTGLRWESIRAGGWALLVLMPVGFIALAHVWLGMWGSTPPFSGRSLNDLTESGNWIAALLIVSCILYVIGRYGRRYGGDQLSRMAVVSAALVLAMITARAAYLAAYINHDYATEYLVYAHAGPRVKTVMDEIERIAELTNEGTNMRVVFDDESSWPFSWYFRDYTNYFLLRGEAGSVDESMLDGARVVVVGNKKAPEVRRMLGDQYYEFSYFRLWWPMQEYFHLTYDDVAGVLSLDGDDVAAPYYREGLFDIWWNRDYSTYAQAMCMDARQYECVNEASAGRDDAERDTLFDSCQNRLVYECADDTRFDVSQWPVSDRMYFFVDKRVAAQVWDAGIGSSTVNIREPEYPEDKVYLDLAAEHIFGADLDMASPRGVTVDTDGTIYIADTDRSRVLALDADGNLLRAIGDPTLVTEEGQSLLQPWGLDVDGDGNIYIADTWNNRVAVYSTAGEFVRTWGHYGDLTDPSTEAMWGPRDLVIGPDELIYVADTGGKRVRVYTKEGEHVRDIGSGGSGQGQIDEPVGLAFNLVSGELYIAESWNKRISVFDTTGMFRRSFDVNMWFQNRTSPNRPYLAVSPDGTLIFVTDMDDRERIVAYNLSGLPVYSFNQADESDEGGSTGVQNPAGLATDADGRLYVLDADQGLLYVFPPPEVSGNVPPVGPGESLIPIPPEGAGEVDAPASGDVAPVGALPPLDAPLLPAGSANAGWIPVTTMINGVEMAYVPGGCVESDGCDLCVSPFWISTTEITNEMYGACVAAGVCTPPGDRIYFDEPVYAQAPVTHITWAQALDVVQWLGGQLPTEAQWEYAARGPEGWLYPWGELDPSCGLANTDGCGGLLPVGDRRAGHSWVKALDLSGGVWEWTLDWFADGYYARVETGTVDPPGVPAGDMRAVRGGSWADGPDAALSSSREGRAPDAGYDNVGVRIIIPADALDNAAGG